MIEDSEIGIESAHSAGAGMIIALATKKNQAMLSKLEGVNRTIINFYELLESIK